MKKILYICDVVWYIATARHIENKHGSVSTDFSEMKVRKTIITKRGQELLLSRRIAYGVGVVSLSSSRLFQTPHFQKDK